MAVTKRLVCLANSRKLSGRCIAGREFEQGRVGAWIRPVSKREHEEVSEYERQYLDGSDPRVLDVMDVPVLEPRPRGYQQENWLLDPNLYWKRAGRIDWSDLVRLADPAEPLWVNGFHTYNGRNDKVPFVRADSLRTSLRLISASRLKLSVLQPGEAFGNPKRRVQGRFRHAGDEYHLWVTDPVYERSLLARLDGEHELGEVFLTVSLGEPYNGACHKLIAAIIDRQGEPPR